VISVDVFCRTVLRKDNMARCVTEPVVVLRLARHREISLWIVVLLFSGIRLPAGGMRCAAIRRWAVGVR